MNAVEAWNGVCAIAPYAEGAREVSALLGESLKAFMGAGQGMFPHCVDSLSVEDGGRIIKLSVLGHRVMCRGALIEASGKGSYCVEYVICAGHEPDGDVIATMRIDTYGRWADWLPDSEFFTTTAGTEKFAEAWLAFLVDAVSRSSLVQRP